MEPQNNESPRLSAGMAATILAISSVVVIGGAAIIYERMSNSGIAGKYNAVETPSVVLVRDNPFFAQANAAARAGNYDQAIQLYGQALEQAADPVQATQIQFIIALLEDRYGSVPRAIELYKEIVADPTNNSTPIVKANAVANMIELYYRNGDPAVTEQIFKDAPYAVFFAPGDTALSYRRLAEYATAFYPLALPELRMASWYANRLTQKSEVSEGEDTSTYEGIIRGAITRADQDIERMRARIDDAQLIPTILTRKSALYLNMYDAGLATAEETETVMKSALTMYSAIGAPVGSDGFARYYYAVFLAKQKPSRADELRAIVAPFYKNQGYKGSFTHTFFASEKANVLAQKARLVMIAKADPEFKALLKSLGWNEKDF